MPGWNRGPLKHGHKRGGGPSPEYRTWLGIKRRCSDARFKDYKNYGARGIRVCDRWQDSFQAFLADMGVRPSPTHQIDRLNPNGDYEPSNCRWVLPQVNSAENKRNLRSVSVEDMSFPSIAAACRHFGVSVTTVNERLKRGIPLNVAVSYKAGENRRKRPRESYLPRCHPDRATLP